MTLDMNAPTIVVDREPYYKTKDLLLELGRKGVIENTLDEDKYHAYSLFVEMVGDDKSETEAVMAACNLMNTNVKQRLNKDLQTLTMNTDYQYQTEEEMIGFVEGFHI